MSAISGLSKTILISKTPKAPVTLPKSSIFSDFKKGFSELFSGKSGSVAKTGVKIGVATGGTGLGLSTLGSGLKSLFEPTISSPFGEVPIALIVGIIAVIIILLVVFKK